MNTNLSNLPNNICPNCNRCPTYGQPYQYWPYYQYIPYPYNPFIVTFGLQQNAYPIPSRNMQ
jgi:hypothetical protein